jgi:alpha-beta hydrolase superfamily lysophospholipase
MAYTLRTRFSKDILAEFLPPKRRSNKVVILLDGLPSVPAKKSVMEYFARRGYWAFHFRYRGTWESGGMFLKSSPEKDLKDVMNGLARGFTELWGKRKFKIKKPAVYLFASSFGGATALLGSHDRRVKKAFLLSPVVDWRVESKKEPLDLLAEFVEKAFGSVYRVRPEDWKKLMSGKFMNPALDRRPYDGKKIFIVHAKDDQIVPFTPTKEFAERIGAGFLPLRYGGHLGLFAVLFPPLGNRVAGFFKKK